MATVIAALAAAAALAVLRLAVTAVMVTAFALFLGAAWTEYRALTDQETTR